jgi:hypothetical protein
MSRKGRNRGARLRYWFDNTLSRGTMGLIGWLAIAAALLVVIVTPVMVALEPNDANVTPLMLLWQTFVTTFSLGIPTDDQWWLLPFWFILGLGGIFIVSALVGLLTSGLNRRLEQLRKGRSQVIEKDHTVVLGWSDQIYTVLSELIEANSSRRRAVVVVLAEQDKVSMEDRVSHRLRDTKNTRLVFRTGSPLDLSDLELVNLNESRSIIVLSPDGTSEEDADAFVLKTLLAINKGPAFRGRPHHVVSAVRDSHSLSVAKIAGGDAIVLDGDDISARLIVQTSWTSVAMRSTWWTRKGSPGCPSARCFRPTVSAVRSACSNPMARPPSARRWTPSSNPATGSFCSHRTTPRLPCPAGLSPSTTRRSCMPSVARPHRRTHCSSAGMAAPPGSFSSWMSTSRQGPLWTL